ncbi:MAG: uroporphyrinogen-III C-methyltransferase [Rhodospirillaceae bacterium]|nr:uroporphyrinogen-III C-methyltransferase [Rhodospirillaceae bacterium]MBT4589008.1 uroporphyrinogen-III C-methyltransferase [Rhodospirillaceae bacterium]MBT4939090.1 uroporphyrinogen-III C-methyltransferase [Rhodospirillaceae bacterium]MBT5940844.1 uroporphyrinogen-III C-methyltransferase [Rhodospirillaceae bacterium]MBT7266692.1 uroporphyrinogen-III C-methyltransferase [Rhodospirillaceae bacterium]
MISIPDSYGPVYLIGAGPGDPELLTVKAMRLLGEADVVVYDRLVSDEILDLVPAGASRIFAGKAADNHHLIQDEINELLVKLARKNYNVVRLKGGDPFVFGRGSEEAEILHEHGISFEVVPGITAASGCTAALGVPLTHRGKSTGVRYVTGHRKNNGELDLNWQSLADPDTTLVIYMGLSSLPLIRDELIKAGMPGDLPALAISKGTTKDQRICRTILAHLPERVAEEKLPTPLLIVIGHVIEVADIWGSIPAPDLMDYLEGAGGG